MGKRLYGRYNEDASERQSCLASICAEAGGSNGSLFAGKGEFKGEAEETESCLTPDCCSAVPAAWGAFPPEYATATRSQVIKSESTSFLLTSMPPLNFPL